MAREPLSIAISSNPEGENDDQGEEEPTQRLIIECIRASPDRTIRPADLSQRLGISINDSSAALCGLLQIVGPGASFHFEDVKVGADNGRTAKSMVFRFPADFERKISRAQRKDTFRAFLKVLVKVLKAVTAFGLLVSIVILSVAIFAALIAALVTLSGGGGRESHAARNRISRKLQEMIVVIRQLLFCFAMFGPTGNDEDGNDSYGFFRDAAYDTWLVMSLCCGNPGSIFFWWRTDRLRQRWERRRSSDLEGISLITRNTWQSDSTDSSRQSSQQKGLVSSLVEFLFGPTARSKSNADKWRLRSLVITTRTTTDGGCARAISLQELAPFVDVFGIAAEGLAIASFFNGVPTTARNDDDDTDDTDEEKNNPAMALFEFPELVSEHHRGVLYDDPRLCDPNSEQGMKNIFYSTLATPRATKTAVACALPEYLHEPREVFSSLSSLQFFGCLFLTLANLFGVVWFSRSLDPGGILEQNLGATGGLLKVGLIPVLWFYARLFVAIPTTRLLYVAVGNQLCKRRNKRRKDLAFQLNNIAKRRPMHQVN